MIYELIYLCIYVHVYICYMSNVNLTHICVYIDIYVQVICSLCKERSSINRQIQYIKINNRFDEM